jgi:pimeloyl-ACP methyl ester carboxylesterase
VIERAAATAVPRATGVFFGARPRFGWIHPPANATGVGLVIVPPFGYEAICAHRALRHLAETAARAGLVAIRVDLDGTGDSAGDDLDHGRLDAWIASVADAADVARQHGADRIVIAGVRLGATIAALAAAKRDDVAGVVAIAAVSSGKAVVREGRALQMQLGLAPAPPGQALPDELHEVVGFALTGETRTALSQIDLVKAQRAPAPAVLVIDRDDRPSNDAWIATLRRLGVAVEHRRLPGYVEMVLDPHRAEVPALICDAVIEFAAARAAPVPDPTRAATVHVAATAEPHTTLDVDGAPVTEEVVAVDDCLVGIVSRPRAAARRAVILLDAGAVYRVGPNRLYVALARRLAARGLLVLRVDQSGIGDSRPRAGATENVVYSDHAIDDVGVAVSWARDQGAREVAVVGLCSGAYHALKAAVAGQPIDTIVPINPLTFFWKPGMPLDFAAFRVTTDAARYGQSVKSVESWKKLLRGEVDVGRVARVVAERARSIVEHRARDVARSLRVPLEDDLGSELLALGRRGVAIRFIFAGDDPGRAMLVEQGGAAVSRLTRDGTLSVDVIDGADHTFTPRWSHPLLLDAIERAVA